MYSHDHLTFMKQYLELIVFVLDIPVVRSVKLECVHLICVVERGDLIWHILTNKFWPLRRDWLDTHNLDICKNDTQRLMVPILTSLSSFLFKNKKKRRQP